MRVKDVIGVFLRGVVSSVLRGVFRRQLGRGFLCLKLAEYATNQSP